MLIFWSIAALLVVVTLTVLLLPLISTRRRSAAPDANAAALAVSRDQNRALDAEPAYGVLRAEALVPDNTTLLADYADALAMAQGRKLSGKPAELAGRALTIDPNHKKALALAGTAALEANDLGGAIGYYRRLLAQLPEGSDDAKQITAIIAKVESAKSGGKGLPPSAPAPERAPPPVLASPGSNAAI